jgi:rhodanese-related sulfurtransferase
MRHYIEINQNKLVDVLALPNTLLLDIRETGEFLDFNIGGINIPPHEITTRILELMDFQNIIVACSNGTRSSMVARLLLKKLPDTTIYHLEEGIF